MEFRRKDFFTLNFYKKQPYTASCNGTRIRLFKVDQEDGNSVLTLATWPEPFSYDHTPEEEKTYRNFSYSEEGIQEIIQWLNDNLAHNDKQSQDSTDMK